MPKPFSHKLEQWLKSQRPKTLADVSEVFKEKSFAIIVVLLMFLPALPLPTGGVTHVFELIVMLLSVQLMLGGRTGWLPKAWRHKPLGKAAEGKVIPQVIRRIRWLERYSRPRFVGLINHRHFLRLVGLFFFIFALAAFVSPPFAGLDTLPALGCVLIALSLILEDIVVFIAGLLLGAIGVGLVVATGSLTLHFIERLF